MITTNRRGFFILSGVLAACVGLGVAAPADAQTASRFDEVKKRGKLIAGIRFGQPPYGTIDPAGQNIGLDVDLSREIARRMGVELEIVQVTGASRVPMLESGKVDAVFAGLAQTRKREQAVDFSIPYLSEGEKLLVKRGSPIRSHKDLDGKTVAAVPGTTSEEIVNRLAPGAKIVRQQELPQAFLALKQGIVDVFASSELILAKFANAEPGQYEIVGPFMMEYPVAIGLPPNDSKWRDFMNHTLQDMEEDGTFAKMFDKWVGKDSEYKLPVPKIQQWPK